MSLSASTRNVSKAVENVDAVDLTLPDNPNLRAILFPKSESALYSTCLQENKSLLFLVKESICLLSPDASSSEDEGSPTLNDEDNSKGHTHTTRRRRNRSKATILLEQSENKEKFTLGGSRDNEVVLEHPYSADEESCYINLFHAQLYPDPDRDSLILFNGSASIFYVQSLTVPQVENNIIPGEEATLECGRWQVTFGKGLDFEIKILPWAAREIYYDWVLISPPPVISLPTKRSEKEAAIKPRADSRNRTREDRGKTGENRKTIREDWGKIGEDGKTTGKDGKIPRARALDILIGKTHRTLVFKGATQKGTTVAIKVCRQPTVKKSADTWRNEKEILSSLDHPSIIKLLNYDALNLHLELEYGGPDLSNFVDRQGMSELSKDTAHQIWIDISSGVEYLHSKEILHLDIKAENILLSEGRRAKICDFGFSVQHVVEPILWDGGTPTYTPPEFVRTGKRGRPADIWDCGLVVMFVLGIWPLPPLGKWTIANIRKEKGDAATKMLEWFSEVERSKERIPDKYSLLLRMLAINPSQRITSSELVENLPKLLQVEALIGELLL